MMLLELINLLDGYLLQHKHGHQDKFWKEITLPKAITENQV